MINEHDQLDFKGWTNDMEKAAARKRYIPKASETTVYPILFLIGASHLLNDALQAVIPAMFPILEESLALSFTQLGFIAFTLNMISSVMQPVIGMYTDKNPMPFALPIGLMSSLIGVVALAFSPNFWTILISVFFIGLGSAIFHPEGSRVSYLAAGHKRGLAQSIFQVGGNTGQAMAPIITAIVLVPLGQRGAAWFAIIAGIAVIILTAIARWYRDQMTIPAPLPKKKTTKEEKVKLRSSIKWAILLIILLIFARSWYVNAISNFYAFYTIAEYGFSIKQAQIYLFAFMFTGAVGTFFGGPIADRIGRKRTILASVFLPAPLTIALPYVNATLAIIFLILIGFLLMSSFSVTVVYAQELVPGKIGMMSGLTVGLAFGMGAIGSVALGSLIDWIGLTPTMILISFLPLIGLVAQLLPSDETVRKWNTEGN